MDVLWTTARIKSCTHPEVIGRYNHRFHGQLGDAVCRFFVPEVQTDDGIILYCKTYLFVCVDCGDEKLPEFYYKWNECDPAMYGPVRYHGNIVITPPHEMQRFILTLEQSDAQKAVHEFMIGDEVEVVSGLFLGTTGKIIELQEQNVTIEVDAYDSRTRLVILKNQIIRWKK